MFGKGKVLKNGAKAQAVIRDSDMTGLSNSHGAHKWRLELRVQFDDGTTADVSCKAYEVNLATGFGPGQIVPVRYDPNDRTKVEVDSRRDGRREPGTPRGRTSRPGRARRTETRPGREASDRQLGSLQHEPGGSMRQLGFLTAVAAVALALVGCGGSSDSSGSETVTLSNGETLTKAEANRPDLREGPRRLQTRLRGDRKRRRRRHPRELRKRLSPGLQERPDLGRRSLRSSRRALLRALVLFFVDLGGRLK